MPASQRLVLTHSCTPNPVQVNKLDGLQHMHIPSGQTYKSPGMAYVEGDASSGEHNSLFLLLHTPRCPPAAACIQACHCQAPDQRRDCLTSCAFGCPAAFGLLPGRQQVAGNRATIAPQSTPVQSPACTPIFTCRSSMPFIIQLSRAHHPLRSLVLPGGRPQSTLRVPITNALHHFTFLVPTMHPCAASYFLAGATMTGGTITVEGCGSDSLQVTKPAVYF